MARQVGVIKISLPGMTPLMGDARREAARLWNRLVKLHRWGRQRGLWFSEAQFKAHFKGRFALHSQTVQGLIEKFFSNLDSTRTQRKQGNTTARYPWKSKARFYVVLWKGQSVKVVGHHLVLPMGKGRKPLLMRIPDALPPGQIAQVELGYFELRITLTREVQYPEQQQGIASIDPGIIHFAATGTVGQAEIGVGRGLRSVIQGHNKSKAEITRLLSRCRKGSRRWRKLKRALAKRRARRDNIQRNFLHHTANQVVTFCEKQGVGVVVLGNIGTLNQNKKRKSSKRNNQANGNNPFGQFRQYLEYKLKTIGASLVLQDERYTSQTCPACGHRHKPAGRVYRCRCGFTAPRDIVGQANILNKALHGEIVPGTTLPAQSVKYLRPVKLAVVGRMMRGTLPSKTSVAKSVLQNEGPRPVSSSGLASDGIRKVA
jgi:putative transposase